MNCKQGDLAVLVRSDSGNEGAVVQCLRLYVGQLLNPDKTLTATVVAWFIDRNLPTLDGSLCLIVEDSKLRPLRDTDGEDEILRIAGRPATEGALHD